LPAFRVPGPLDPSKGIIRTLSQAFMTSPKPLGSLNSDAAAVKLAWASDIYVGAAGSSVLFGNWMQNRGLYSTAPGTGRAILAVQDSSGAYIFSSYTDQVSPLLHPGQSSWTG